MEGVRRRGKSSYGGGRNHISTEAFNEPVTGDEANQATSTGLCVISPNSSHSCGSQSIKYVQRHWKADVLKDSFPQSMEGGRDAPCELGSQQEL